MAFDYINYDRAEYISSDGTGQYIETGIQVYDYSSNLVIDTMMKFNAIPSNIELLFGTGYRSADNNPTVYTYGVGCRPATSSSNYTVIVGTTLSASSINTNTPINTSAPSSINHTKNGIRSIFNIDNITTSTNGNFSANYRTLKIFSGVSTGTSGTRNAPYYFANASLYDHFRISANDVLLAEYIPAKRKSDNVYGLYDTVAETFLTNQGTGVFTGRDLPSSSNIYVYDNGTWKKGTPYVYDNGTWKQGKPYVYDNGTWKS